MRTLFDKLNDIRSKWAKDSSRWDQWAVEEWPRTVENDDEYEADDTSEAPHQSKAGTKTEASPPVSATPASEAVLSGLEEHFERLGLESMDEEQQRQLHEVISQIDRLEVSRTKPLPESSLCFLDFRTRKE